MPFRAVNDRDKGQDLPFQGELDQAFLGPVSRVCDQPVGAQAETFRGAVEHREGRAYLGLPDRSGRIDIHDDSMIGINQVIV
jgi:hypothetical protein